MTKVSKKVSKLKLFLISSHDTVFHQVRELSGGAGGMSLAASMHRVPSSEHIAKRMRGCACKYYQHV